MDRVPMTVQGAENLQQEIEYLRKVMRPKIVKAIAEAREHGDLKENAEYSAAKEQQSFTEGRIHEIEAKLARAQIIDVTKFENKGRVIFGATVTLIHLETEEMLVYKIVGEDEADIKEQKISSGSPIARALIGKEVGETVVVQAPSGTIEYEISEVKYI